MSEQITKQYSGTRVMYETTTLAGIPRDNSRMSFDKPVSPFDISKSNYSLLTKLLRVSAWALRFIRKLQKKNTTKGQLTPDEINQAKVCGRSMSRRVRSHQKSMQSKRVFPSLVIKSFHGKLMHAGVSHTLAAIRREFWIPQGRSSVRRVLLNCLRCRGHQGGPYRIPAMAPYPRSRV